MYTYMCVYIYIYMYVCVARSHGARTMADLQEVEYCSAVEQRREVGDSGLEDTVEHHISLEDCEVEPEDVGSRDGCRLQLHPRQRRYYEEIEELLKPQKPGEREERAEARLMRSQKTVFLEKFRAVTEERLKNMSRMQLMQELIPAA